MKYDTHKKYDEEKNWWIRVHQKSELLFKRRCCENEKTGKSGEKNICKARGIKDLYSQYIKESQLSNRNYVIFLIGRRFEQTLYS